MKSRTTEDVDTRRLIRTAHALLTRGGTLESSSGTAPINEDRLSAALQRHFEREMAFAQTKGAADTTTAGTVVQEVLASAKIALMKNADASLARLTDLEVASLEAIVEVTGRPALRYKDGNVEMPNDLGENDRWRVLIAVSRAKINRASQAVGRVVISTSANGDDLVGTAWRIGNDLVVTNRHVLACLVMSPDDPFPAWKLDSGKKSFVNFGTTEGGNSSCRIKVNGIAYCAPDPEIDLAVLTLDCSCLKAPGPLTIDWSPDSLGYLLPASEGDIPRWKGAAVYVVGHPYRELSSEPIAAVFGVADGSKRCCPGFVTAIGKTEPVIEHDCSTLGGNSGSCVLTTDLHQVVGLHFGGRGVNLFTGRGSTNVALAFSRVANNDFAKILRVETASGG